MKGTLIIYAVGFLSVIVVELNAIPAIPTVYCGLNMVLTKCSPCSETCGEKRGPCASTRTCTKDRTFCECMPHFSIPYPDANFCIRSDDCQFWITP